MTDSRGDAQPKSALEETTEVVEKWARSKRRKLRGFLVRCYSAVRLAMSLFARIIQVQRGVGEKPNVPGQHSAQARPGSVGWPKENNEDAFLATPFPIGEQPFDVTSTAPLDPPSPSQIDAERSRRRIVRVSRAITSAQRRVAVVGRR